LSGSVPTKLSSSISCPHLVFKVVYEMQVETLRHEVLAGDYSSMLMNETNQHISIVKVVIVNVNTGLILRITICIRLIVIIAHQVINGK